MRVFVTLVVLLIAAYPSKAQPNIQRSDSSESIWLLSSANVLNSSAPDWSILERYLSGIRVVGIGGSRSMPPEFAGPATALVRYLHEEMGFDVLLLESGLAEAGASWTAADTLSTEDYMRSMSRRVCAREEMRSLFEYAISTRRTPRPLVLLGIDDMPSFSIFRAFLERWAHETGYPAVESLLLAEDLWRGVWVEHLDDEPYLESARLAASEYDRALAFLDTLPSESPGPGGFRQSEWLRRALIVRREAIRPERFLNREVIEADRDRTMGENIVWVARVLFPRQKIIVWAANGHVTEAAKGTAGRFPRAGAVAASSLGDSLYTIGFFTGGGSLPHFHETRLPDPLPGSLEARLSVIGADLFYLHLSHDGPSWLREPFPASIEVRFVQPLSIDDHFDGLVFTKSISEGKPLR